MMEPIFDFGLDATRWLQTSYPQLEGFFQFISQLGQEEFYLALLPLIYWCLDKRLGKHLAYVFLFSNAFNPMFKHAFRGPRPYWLDGSVKLAEEASYGIPSGHTQNAAALYLFLAGWLRRRLVWVLALLMVLIMGVSRVYLGVHFVHDVLAGLLIAVVVLLGYFSWKRRLATGFRKRILGQRLLAAIAVPILLALIYTIIRFAIGPPDQSVTWAVFTPDAELSGMTGMATSIGALLGMGIGIIFEGSRVRFKANGPVWKRVIRYLLGLVITIVIWAGLKAVFPADPLWLAIPLRILRYLLTLLWVAYYAPMAFVYLSLAEAEPDPGISLKM